MKSRHDRSLSINDNNRHQYLETAIASVSDTDKLIRQAEARGQLRRQRENELKKILKRVSVSALVIVVAGALLALFIR